MKAAIVGAGPAGLHCARLLRRARPDITVDVFEQGPQGATWGFGVGLGARSLQDLAALDPDLHIEISKLVRLERRQVIRRDDDSVTLDYSEDMGAISRLDLLTLLAQAAAASGATVHHDFRRDDLDALSGRYDLVVASDGINSALRELRRDAFGVRSHELTNRFAWYGVAAVLGPVTLSFKTQEAGVLIGHHYAYGPTMSTFVAECDAAAWQGSGLGGMDDAGRKALFERAFAQELGDRPLIANNSTWRRFPVTTTDRFFDGNVVLIGDALRGAHFSIGSGTRLAMDDAATLVAALSTAGSDVAAGLRQFEANRRRARNVFGEAARKSFEWYENVAEHIKGDMIDFVHGYMTRTGRVDDARLQSYAPGFYQALVEHRRTAGSAPLARTGTSR